MITEARTYETTHTASPQKRRAQEVWGYNPASRDASMKESREKPLKMTGTRKRRLRTTRIFLKERIKLGV
jgi:hypothetical protein